MVEPGVPPQGPTSSSNGRWDHVQTLREVERMTLDTAARTAIKDADSLSAALNKWALNTSDASQTRALRQAVLAIDASEDTLISFLGKAPRSRPWERKNQRSPEDKPI